MRYRYDGTDPEGKNVRIEFDAPDGATPEQVEKMLEEAMKHLGDHAKFQALPEPERLKIYLARLIAKCRELRDGSQYRLSEITDGTMTSQEASFRSHICVELDMSLLTIPQEYHNHPDVKGT